MSLFQCKDCGCVENTATAGGRGYVNMPASCSACEEPGPDYEGREKINARPGKWHGEFKREFLKKGEYKTCERGDLVHKKTGKPPAEEDYRDKEWDGRLHQT